MSGPAWLYRMYESRLQRQLKGARMPRHVAVMLDGNRRWAKEIGRSATYGHARGAEKITDFLGWCSESGIELVTLWLLSTDNVKRAKEELEPLLEIIATTVENLASVHEWEMSIVGNLDMLPVDYAGRLRHAVSTQSKLMNSSPESAQAHGSPKPEEGGSSKLHVNIAVMYGGRQEITDAVQAYLHEQAEAGKTLEQVAQDFSLEDIGNHLYTRGQPDPDLVIRTSGEQRMSGFMLWQSVHTELYFCETYWPAFRRVDFLRALRDFTLRDRRKGA
ncbi:polyprenyl diphosphate synthase [Actinotignum urinale]|uniref:polyprenyl diphosphate synthase n=1 Tax=Actinotignum urinale TaxID=190146 RepID=UPI002A821553|nr:polyprenyl diphosphate synthase [Actinotignum urinale]MDY5151909.1 polyprenyl diphosphate synthase [Actinotignum urinale]